MDASRQVHYTGTVVSFDGEAKPEIRREGKNTTVTMGLTIPEACYVAFRLDAIKGSLARKNAFIFLGCKPETESSFKHYAVHMVGKSDLTPEDLKLQQVLQSLWDKTRSFVLNNCRIANPSAEGSLTAAFEQAGVEEAKKHQAGLPGKMFTAEQAAQLVRFAVNVSQHVQKSQ